MQVREGEHRERGGFVGHRVRVGAPHHHRPLLERFDQPHGDRLPVAGDAWGDELTAGERERDLEPIGGAGEVLDALWAMHIAAVLPGSAGQPRMPCAEPLGDREDRRVAQWVAGVDQERHRWGPAVGGVQDFADDVQVAA